MLADEVSIFVEGGRGGDGCVSFHREKYKPKGGPDGGDGGRGGDVILEGSESVNVLWELGKKSNYRAGVGGSGGPNRKKGKKGRDLILKVPLGTLVYSTEGFPIADILFPGQRVTVASGGRGGRGNASLVREAGPLPTFRERGEPGERKEIRLVLKRIADVAVVGFPNAGKSTLVSALSNAKPKIATYPFTTIEPVCGLVTHWKQEFVVIEIPGLVKGAHLGKGMGTKFLRHVERSPVIVFLIDISGAEGRKPLDDLRNLEVELSLYNKDFLERSIVVVGNKIDLNPPAECRMSLGEVCKEKGWPLFEVSAAGGEGLSELCEKLAELVREAREEGFTSGEVVSYSFRVEEGFVRVSRRGSRFVAEGPLIERLVQMTDWGSEEGIKMLVEKLRTTGVEELLKGEGALPGDEVEIAGRVFEFMPEEGLS